MRKVALSLILVISFTFFYNYIPVSATSTTIPSDFVNFEDIIGFQDIGYALIGGAEFNLTDSKYVIEDYSALSAAGKLEAERQKIKEFLQDYEASRGIGYSNSEGALYQGQSYYTTAFTQNANKIQEQYSISSVNVDWAMGISPYKFADWAQYNRYWINRYVNSFDVNVEPVVPDWASQYVERLSKIWLKANNLTDYMDFTNVNVKPGDYGEIFFWNNRLDYSYIKVSDYSNLWIAIDPIDIFITTNANGGFDFTTSNLNYRYNVFGYTYYGNNIFYNSFFPQDYDQNGIWIGQGSPSVSSYTQSGHFDVLQDLIDYIYHGYVHIRSLTLDGEEWIDPAPANPTIPSFPDVIVHDDNFAYDIPFPNTPTYEGNFDITSVFDALREAIIGASDSDSTTSGTLTGEKVVDTYDGVDIDTQDKVVDLTSTKVFAGTLEDTTTDRLPDIPVPPIGVHNGLAGATVLAKYIDATQCILPEELITVFWGGFFILIILGLIKSLHR